MPPNDLPPLRPLLQNQLVRAVFPPCTTVPPVRHVPSERMNRHRLPDAQSVRRFRVFQDVRVRRELAIAPGTLVAAIRVLDMAGSGDDGAFVETQVQPVEFPVPPGGLDPGKDFTDLAFRGHGGFSCGLGPDQAASGSGVGLNELSDRAALLAIQGYAS